MAQYDIVFHINANASGELFAERKISLPKGCLLAGSDDYPTVLAPRSNRAVFATNTQEPSGFIDNPAYHHDGANQAVIIVENSNDQTKPREFSLTEWVSGAYGRPLMKYSINPYFSSAFSLNCYDLTDKLELPGNATLNVDAETGFSFAHNNGVFAINNYSIYGTAESSVEFYVGSSALNITADNFTIRRPALDVLTLESDNNGSATLGVLPEDPAAGGYGCQIGLFAFVAGAPDLYAKSGQQDTDWSMMMRPDLDGVIPVKSGLNMMVLKADYTANAFEVKTNVHRLIGGNVDSNGYAVYRIKSTALATKDIIGSYGFVPQAEGNSASARITAVASNTHGSNSHPTALLFGNALDGQIGSVDQYRMMLDRYGNVLFKTSGIDITGTLPTAKSGVDIHDSVGFGPTVQTTGNHSIGNEYCYMLTNAATGNATFYLPDLASVEGRNYMVVNATGTRTITIARAGTDKINGVTNPSIVLNAGDVVFIHATGNSQYGWFVSGNVKR
ncbi:MAG: hypothetical protein KGZ82_04180 [Bacteroidales bacterium]|nr:hypothetical protein [Bacteroidales bacterium]